MMARYKIFGKSVEIKFDEKRYKNLREELSLYPISNEQPDVVINIVEKLDIPDDYIQNPETHYTFSKGFLADYGHTQVMYLKDNGLLKVSLRKPSKIGLPKRFLNMEFATAEDMIGQILHELVLVPMNYFFSDRFLVHSSAFQSPEGKTFLIGGTGGIGKTSLELFLCKERNFKFIADDITVVDKTGKVYPNLAFPKIYGYNAKGKRDITKLLLLKRSLLNKIHWHLSMKIRGENKVRRKVSPLKLYGSYLSNETRVSTYFILIRDKDVNELVKQPINSELAAELTLRVIQNEYYVFHQHIVWHEFNTLVKKIEPVVRVDKTFANWRTMVTEVFRNLELYIVRVPERYGHQEFLTDFYTHIIR